MFNPEQQVNSRENIIRKAEIFDAPIIFDLLGKGNNFEIIMSCGFGLLLIE